MGGKGKGREGNGRKGKGSKGRESKREREREGTEGRRGPRIQLLPWSSENLGPDLIVKAVGEWQKKLQACVVARRGQFEHKM